MLTRNGFQRRHFSLLTKMFGQSSKSLDSNKALQELNIQRDCQLTFKDIWQDYRHFKDAFYFHQFPNPSTEMRRPERTTDVDMNKFSLRQTLWDSFFYGSHSAPRWSPRWLFSTLAQMTLVVFIGDLLSAPVRKYYHFEDPLKSGIKAGASGEDGDDVSLAGTNLEKLKYSQRLKPSAFDAK